MVIIRQEQVILREGHVLVMQGTSFPPHSPHDHDTLAFTRYSILLRTSSRSSPLFLTLVPDLLP